MKINPIYATQEREPFFELVKPFIKENFKVLDIGCGHAMFSKYFGRTDFYHFDGNEETVKVLQNEYEHVYQGILPKLPFEDQQFDVIHCSHVLEHLDAETLYQTLIEMNRCLKSGGFLVISAPLMWSGFYNDLSHVRPYPPKVFIHYLCGRSKHNRNRKLIEADYKKKDLVYRYHEIEIRHHYFYYSNSVLSKILNAFIKLMALLGLRSFEQSGFTLILQKQ